MTRRFGDSFIKTKREPKPHETEIKRGAKEIVTRIEGGEEVITTVVHYSEIVNVLETHIPLKEAMLVERALLLKGNLEILQVSKNDYLQALDRSEEFKVGLNDILAYVIMRGLGMSEVYSFDSDFDAFGDVERITT
ncbi:MAG: type II toxin-antitoxin system VapC family toxin [Candidatus Bathyarchaeia archaeon]